MRPHDRCGTDNGGPGTSPWIEGPHARFDEIGPSRLALESLRWFEGSPEVILWPETARLELVYPSDVLKVTARYAPDLNLSWEEQLQVWFEHFPPGGEGSSEVDWREYYSWDIDFGDRGEVDGVAASDSTALERMKSLLPNLELSPIFQQPSFRLSLGVRRSSHMMDCYPVHADTSEELDDLPLRLREKRAKYGGG